MMEFKDTIFFNLLSDEHSKYVISPTSSCVFFMSSLRYECVSDYALQQSGFLPLENEELNVAKEMVINSNFMSKCFHPEL